MTLIPVLILFVVPPSAPTVQDYAELVRASEYTQACGGEVIGPLVQLDGVQVLVAGPMPASGVWWAPWGMTWTTTDCETSTPESLVIEIVQPQIGAVEVSCGSGWYACCWCNSNGCPIARCRKNANGDDSECQAGGQGSTACSIGKSDCAD